MRKLIISTIAIASLQLSSGAQAQLQDIRQIINGAVSLCISQGFGGPNFCSCYVNRWVGLWDSNDIFVWTQTGSATLHMRQMEPVAAAQCRR